MKAFVVRGIDRHRGTEMQMARLYSFLRGFFGHSPQTDNKIIGIKKATIRRLFRNKWECKRYGLKPFFALLIAP